MAGIYRRTAFSTPVLGNAQLILGKTQKNAYVTILKNFTCEGSHFLRYAKFCVTVKIGDSDVGFQFGLVDESQELLLAFADLSVLLPSWRLEESGLLCV